MSQLDYAAAAALVASAGALLYFRDKAQRLWIARESVNLRAQQLRDAS